MSKEKQYYWVDIESGVRFPCTKEYYDSMTKLWEDVKPVGNFNKGIQLITGTPGEKTWVKDKYISGIDPTSGGDSKGVNIFIPLYFDVLPESSKNHEF